MMSDMFMRNVLNILECAEYVLRVITENDDLELTEVVVQKDYKNLQGRSAILDCVAVNGRKEIYDIEVQQEKAGAIPKRLRYHSSIIVYIVCIQEKSLKSCRNRRSFLL